MTDGCGCSNPRSGAGASDKCDSTDKDCPLSNLEVQVLNETTGMPVEDATVTVSGLGSAQTDKDGWAKWKKINPDTYDLEARKDGHVPDPGEKKGVNVPQGTTVKTEIKLDALEYHLHLDADRDGSVDDDRTGLDKWDWGKGKKGAIILCNNDDDEGASKSDNEDDKINKGNDKSEIAALEIRRTGPKPPASWEAFLEVDAADKDKIRIFESRASGAKEILGKTAGKKYKFPDLDFTKKELGMEAVEYAGGGFSGEIMLTFTVKRGGAGSYSEKGKVRVAPWMMPNHLDPAEKAYVVKIGGFNDRFCTELKGFVTSAGCTLHEHPGTDDIWMQDCMEWGYASLPANGFRSVVRAPRDGTLKTFPKTLRAVDLGYDEEGPPGASTFNSTGNLECTPPVTSKAGKAYPWGRIYYGPGRVGEEIEPALKSFLRDQVVQKPIEIDTNWLLVGHVDEIMSFIPAPGGKGFKLLLASPKRAYDILKSKKASNPTAKLLRGREFPDEAPGVNVEVTIKDFLDKGLTALKAKFTHTYMETFNDDRQKDMDGIQSKLETELGLSAADIVPVPILFADIVMSGLADALTAGMVNMLVLNKHCIYPKPFGPVVGGKDLFREDLDKTLKAQGCTPHPLDDWFEYHVRSGEVHCGTNTLRSPTTAKWWEYEP